MSVAEAVDDDELLVELNILAGQLEEIERFNKLQYYRPYPKQLEFHRLGKKRRERMLMAANQVGKTWCAGAEVAFHTTGIYPADWPGFKFSEPSPWWACGVTGEAIRGTVQRVLFGRGRDIGTGMVPAERHQRITWARGVPDLIDTVEVGFERNGVSGTSLITLKSYEKGRAKAQGDTLGGAWLDEEPPLDFYTEVLTRTNRTRGPILLTFTPLLGMSSVVARYLRPNEGVEIKETMTIEEREAIKELEELDKAAGKERGRLSGRTFVQMELRDAGHYTEEDVREIESSYPEHEREARTKGIPMLGSGRVYPLPEEAIMFDLADFPKGFPNYWPCIAAVDFADWDHPVAGMWLRWDRDTDTIYFYDAYKRSKEKLDVHIGAFRDKGQHIPVAWPHDGNKHDRQSGEPIADLWRKKGVKMLKEHSQFEEGGYSVEAGIAVVLERMQTGRLKIASHLKDVFEEFRLYHRKEGRIVKERDDLMDAMRYAVMSLRFARKPIPVGFAPIAKTIRDHSIFR